MNRVAFYEKPGCVGNRRQQVALRAQGVELEVYDLLSQPWTRESLRPFFGSLPVADWFNLSAPAIKSGEIDILRCTEEQALALMLAEPLLIRRPLLELGEIRQAGFADGPALAALGIRPDADEDLQSCPMSDAAPVCETPL